MQVISFFTSSKQNKKTHVLLSSVCIERKETHGMTQNKMAQPGNREQHDERKQLTRNKDDEMI
jgi:hypothetical protein